MFTNVLLQLASKLWSTAPLCNSIVDNSLIQSRGFDAWSFTLGLHLSWNKNQLRLLSWCSADTAPSLPTIRNLAPECCFIFQQDSAPASPESQINHRNSKKKHIRLHSFHIMASEQSRLESCRLWSVERDARASLASSDRNPWYKVINHDLNHDNIYNPWYKRSQATFVRCVGGSGSEDYRL